MEDDIRIRFEVDLRTKVGQKRNSKKSEKGFMLESFKFFDLSNSQCVEFNQFVRVMAKLGIIFNDLASARQIFNDYDKENTGKINYLSFVEHITIGEIQSIPTTPFKSIRGSDKKSVVNQQSQQFNDSKLFNERIQKLRNRLIQRGLTGLLGLAKSLRAQDLGGKDNINNSQFNKVFRDYRVSMDFQDIDYIFEFLDTDKDGLISYKEFIDQLKGDIGEPRRSIVELVVKEVLDPKQIGLISFSSIRDNYFPYDDPLVRSGRKSADDSYNEFLSALDAFSEYSLTKSSSQMTTEDFMNFSRFVSSVYETNEQFIDYFTQVFKIKRDLLSQRSNTSQIIQPQLQQQIQSSRIFPSLQNNQLAQTPKRDQGNNQIEQPSGQVTQQSQVYQQEVQQNLKDFDNLSVKSQAQKSESPEQRRPYNQELEQQLFPRQFQNQTYVLSNNNIKQSLQGSPYSQKNSRTPISQRYDNIHGVQQTVTQRQIELILERIKKRLAYKGAKGFLWLQKLLIMIDLDHDGRISLSEFRKAIRDYRIDVTDVEIDIAFSLFDTQESGFIIYNDFNTALKGDITPQRLDLINKIFVKLDQLKEGSVPLDFIIQEYKPRNHPLVRSGKKTEEELLQEFTDSSIYQNILTMLQQYGWLLFLQGEVNERLSKQDFFEFFHNVSASYSDDKLFEQILISCFRLSNESDLHKQFAGHKNLFDPDHKKGFLQDHHRYLIYGGSVTSNAPFGTFNDPTDYGKPNYRSQLIQDSDSSSVRSTPISRRHNNEQTFNIFEQAKTLVDPDQKHVIQYSLQQEQFEGWNIMKDKLSKRGIRGILNLIRQFKITDYELKGKTDQTNFLKVFKDLRYDFKENDLKKLFSSLDTQNSGFIYYLDLYHTIIGEVKENRLLAIQNVFQQYDIQGLQELPLDFIKNMFNPNNHPNVKSGIESEEEVLSAFIDNIDLFYTLLVPHEKQKRRVIGKDDFIKFYSCQSAIIVSDDQFLGIIKNCWKNVQ